MNDLVAPAAISTIPGGLPSGAGDLLERVHAVNARFPSPESEKFSVRAAADKVLAEFDALPAPAGELSLAVVKLLRHVRKYPEALAVLRRRAETPAANAREFQFLDMVLSFKCGQEAHAMALLEELESSGKLRPSWQRSIATMRARFGRTGARKGVKEMEAAMRKLQCVPDVASYLPVLKERFHAGNTALELLVFVRDRMRALNAIAEPPAFPGLSPFDKYHCARLVFACGFGWSGSGAVSCYLQQHKEVELPFGMSELGYVQGKADKDGLFALLRQVPCGFEEMRLQLAHVLVSSIFCLSSAGYNGPLKTTCTRENGRVAVLARLIDDFTRLMLSRAALDDLYVRSRIVGRFLECLLSIRGGDTILLNNVLVAAKLEILPFMDHSKFVVVQRDVRDQFTARRFEARDMHKLGLDVESFRRFVGRNREKFEQARRQAVHREAQDRMLFIKFEDFIRHEDVRLGVLDFLGLARAGLVADPRKFDASVSARNIGIHRAEASAEEVAYLEREMGVYLPDAVAPGAGEI